MTQPIKLPVSMNTRQLKVASTVVLLHVAALWALQQGLLQRAVEVFVPVSVLASISSPALPPAPQPQQKAPPPPVPQPKVQPTPAPVLTRDNTPAPNAPVVAANPAPVALPPIAPAAPAPVPARVEPPSSVADYLNNPPPPYPALSKRLREEGRVVVRVLIGIDGKPQEGKVVQSSGYERLDNAAYNAVMGWRYVPGKRGGVPTAMTFDVPLIFELK
jgi:periplasmic protein TonB